MDIHKIYNIFMKRFRPKRAKYIADNFPLMFDSKSNILDIGGGSYPWDILDPAAHVTILNVSRPHTIPTDCKWEFVEGDGTKLKYPDKSFDLIFSNSVIEHVGDWSAQQAFASEMLRVGKKIYCQTPNKWFLVEPHFITIFIHWLPFPLLRRLIRYFSIWGLVNKPPQEIIDEYLLSTRLLTYGQLVLLFPGCDIQSEKVLGFAKSYIVLKN